MSPLMVALLSLLLLFFLLWGGDEGEVGSAVVTSTGGGEGDDRGGRGGFIDCVGEDSVSVDGDCGSFDVLAAVVLVGDEGVGGALLAACLIMARTD